MQECIFCKIARGEIPSEIVYQDETVLAFKDIRPQAPVHLLIIPREHIPTWNENTDHVVGAMWQVVRKMAQSMGIHESGYRVVANCNKDGGQEVFHIHLHLLGGRPLHWPPG
ncbi:MAG: histidine triad nucleotide-binding protein [Brevinematales bacterium]|nr:histidine triad nucleotide-binding protein [Brevinematales bacterium]